MRQSCLWHYTHAFLAYLKGDAGKASCLLGLAEKSKPDAFIDGSIKVFRMYLDAKLSHFFEMIDSLGVDIAIRYVEMTASSMSEIDCFLNVRGYIGDDYLNDILGTQCLRNMRCKEATEYLGRVSCAYKTHHNVFMIYAPFTADLKGIRMKSDFRYDFAREMYSLEQGIASAPNPSWKPCSW